MVEASNNILTIQAILAGERIENGLTESKTKDGRMGAALNDRIAATNISKKKTKTKLLFEEFSFEVYKGNQA